MRRELLFLQDIIAASDTIAKFIAELDLDSFLSNPLVQSAVLYQLTIIGEAANHVSAAMQERHPDLPWANMIGLRNIVVHQYFGIDWHEVWRTAILDIPNLRVQMAEVLQFEFPE